LNQHSFRQLISGQSTGFKAYIFRQFLAAISQFYKIIVHIRNFLYSGGWLKIRRADAVVISIGNITTGGTGKTPLVIWMCNTINKISNIKNQKCGVAILTRGYKARAMVDEPAIFAESCPQAKVIVNPNRVEAANEAVVKFGAKAMIMDDGFQHRRLHRDIDIVTIDATCPFGYGRLLPAGLLREPVSSLNRADAAVLTRCNQISETELSRIEQALLSIKPDMIIAKSMHKPAYVKSPADKEIAIEQLKGKKIFAFCGIGNPDAFLSTIKNTGANLVGSKIYDDHYHYTVSDIDDIHNQATRLRADLILSTQKDHTHYAALNKHYEIPFAYLAVEIKFTAGEEKLKQLIKDALEGKIHKKYR
jgi:tetraacyldisaccharide 4'-kinase